MPSYKSRASRSRAQDQNIVKLIQKKEIINLSDLVTLGNKMKSLFSLIVLTTLVAQLPQIQAAPGPHSELNTELIAVLQGLFENKLIINNMEDVVTQSGHGFYSTSCSNDITRYGILKHLSDLYGSQFAVEIHCGHSTPPCTRLTSYENPSFQKYLELCDKGEHIKLKLLPCMVCSETDFCVSQ